MGPNGIPRPWNRVGDLVQLQLGSVIMSRSNGMSKLARVMRIGQFCEREKISTSEGMERVAEMGSRHAPFPM